MEVHSDDQHNLAEERLIPNERDNVYPTCKSERTGLAKLIVACGIIDIIFGIVLIVQYEESKRYHANIGWGVWIGAFAIITGCVGVASKRNKFFVLTYLPLCIAALLVTIIGCVWSSIVVSNVLTFLEYQSVSIIVIYCLTMCVFDVQLLVCLISMIVTSYTAWIMQKTSGECTTNGPQTPYSPDNPRSVALFTVSYPTMTDLPPSYSLYDNEPPPPYSI